MTGGCESTASVDLGMASRGVYTSDLQVMTVDCLTFMAAMLIVFEKEENLRVHKWCVHTRAYLTVTGYELLKHFCSSTERV